MNAFLKRVTVLLWAATAGSLTVTGSFALGQQTSPEFTAESWTFVLDCSSRMNTPLPPDRRVAAAAAVTGPSRLNAARTEMLKRLQQLAEQENHRVSVWLFGHRLASWEKEGDEPGLREQTNYLAQTQGFKVLRTLLPGDDVEQLHPPRFLNISQVNGLGVAMNQLRPWGESPLLLALTDSILAQPRRATSSDSRLIVLTAGSNQRSRSQRAASLDSLLEALRQRPIGVHLITLGEPPADADREPLERIVAASRGKLHHASTPTELAEAMTRAMTHPVRNSPAEPRRLTVTDGPAVRQGTVEGEVLLFSRPIAGARLSLTGGPEDIQRETRTNSQGAFAFKRLPPGKYSVNVLAVVQNKLRRGEFPVRVRGGETNRVELKVR